MEDKKTLAETLERFNRKERNLLIRDILDCCGKPPRLGQNFCDWLAEYADIPRKSLDDAWWATDFHFDWLAGALLDFVGGEPVQCNTPMPNDGATGVRLVMGNQEDVDLVIVAHDREARTYHLLLLEAKAYSPDDPEQYARKLNRLNLLHAFYTRLKEESPQTSDSPHEIVFHLIRYPPPNNEGVGPVRLPPPKITTERNGTNRTLKWSESPMTVTRCNEMGKSDKRGAHWRCEPS